jgi:pyruvate carboxylase
VLTIRIIHEHRHHLEGDLLLSIAAAFQAQVDRLKAFVTSLEGGASAQSDEDVAALTSALDAAGAPPAVEAPSEG